MIIILSVEIALCVLGAVGNISSFAVLLRHRDEIAASRILLGLTAADTGVLLSLISNASLGIIFICGIPVSDGFYTRRAYEYFYICSIYMTVVVSVDRYLVTSRPLMMRRLNHKAIQWRAQLVVAIVSAIMLLPEIISRHVYIDGCTSHMVSINIESFTHQVITTGTIYICSWKYNKELVPAHIFITSEKGCPVCLNGKVDETEHYFHENFDETEYHL